MLCGNNVRKHNRAKRTLIGHNEPIHMLSKVVPRQFGFDMVMSQLIFAAALMSTLNSLGNLDLTAYNMKGFVERALSLTILVSKVMHVPGPDFLKIERAQPVLNILISKNSNGVLDYPSYDVFITSFGERRVFYIFDKLDSVGILAARSLVPFEFSKTCSKQASRGVRVSGQALGPFELTNSKFKMDWENTRLFKNLLVALLSTPSEEAL
jgi:hypothetical protein